jgi:hypothetical protein
MSRTPSGVKPDVHVLIVLAVGRRLKIARVRTTKSKTPMATAATINLNTAFARAFEDKAGSGKLTLRSRVQALVTNANCLLWNTV